MGGAEAAAAIGECLLNRETTMQDLLRQVLLMLVLLGVIVLSGRL